MNDVPTYVCPGCGAVQERKPEGYTVLHHAKGCLRGAAITGGEFESAKAHADARFASEESMANDYRVMKQRGDTR